MYPRYHILFGAIFAFLVFMIFPDINIIYIVLIFLASIFIDLDHYLAFVMRERNWNLFDSFKFYDELEKRAERERKRGIYKKCVFHFFHTIEFHLVVLILACFWNLFLYIFIGIVFHSILDIIYMSRKKGALSGREFLFICWLKETCHCFG